MSDVAGPIALVPAPEAAAGAGDATRRWALSFPDGADRFAGITPTEAADAIPDLLGMESDRWDRSLVEVVLPVIVSDGAGPYLLDATGRMTLALGEHPRLGGARVAMGEPRPRHRVGVVRRAGPRLWEWLHDAEVAPGARVAALEALDAVGDADQGDAWARRDWR